MTEETKKLSIAASQLYESERINWQEIYELLTTTKSRIKEVTLSRQLVGYVLYNHYGLTLKQVAKEIGLLCHSSIIYFIDNIQVQLRNNKRMQYRYNYMLEVMAGNSKEIIKPKHIKVIKTVLTVGDIDFIRSNYKKDFSISYYSDILKKHKNPIRRYLKILENELGPAGLKGKSLYTYSTGNNNVNTSSY
jgi:hypothetical protein